MNFYEKHCLPLLLNAACGMQAFQRQRALSVPHAHGRVLEIGFGTGLNLPFYNTEQVDFIWGLEPSEGMRQHAQKNIARSPLDVRWLGLPSETIPLEDNSADTVLLTYTLCTIPDWRSALSEMRRVLKPNGTLIFSEHGRAPDPGVRKWQERINPYWNKAFGGCNLNRPIAELIGQCGFSVENLDTDYIIPLKISGFNYRGFAKPI